MADGDVEFALDLILRPPSELQNVEIGAFLLWLPRFGPSRLRAMIRGMLFSERVPMSDLSERSRRAIVAAVRETYLRRGVLCAA